MSNQMSLEGLRLSYEVEQRGYYELQHGIPDELIEALVSSYVDFSLAHPDPRPATMSAMLPGTPLDLGSFKLDDLDRSQDQEKEWHKYRTNVPGVGKPDGYTNRTFQIATLEEIRTITLDDDPKEYYHHTPVHFDNMARAHEKYDWGFIPPEVTALDKAFEPIHQMASQLMLKICALIEETHPELAGLVTLESLRTSPIRLAGYHLTQAFLLAGGHYDKAPFTIQIAESHEGLEIARVEDIEPVRVVRGPSTGVFFPGRGIQEQLGQSTTFKPTWHRVTNAENLNEGRNVPIKGQDMFGRWAIIMFGHAITFVEPDKKAMHTRH